MSHIPIDVGIKVGSYRTIESLKVFWQETRESESRRYMLFGSILILAGAVMMLILASISPRSEFLGFMVSIFGLLMLMAFSIRGTRSSEKEEVVPTKERAVCNDPEPETEGYNTGYI